MSCPKYLHILVLFVFIIFCIFFDFPLPHFFTNHGNYQSSTKTFQSSEANQITNVQHSSNTHSAYGSETWTIKEQD
jgi:hypothetical protein